MALLWEFGPMYVREMIERMPEPKPHFNTVSTFVRLLEQKGFVGHEKIGNSYRYSAVMTREQYGSAALDDFISTYFGGSAKAVLDLLARRGMISDDDLWDLMAEMRSARKKAD